MKKDRILIAGVVAMFFVLNCVAHAADVEVKDDLKKKEQEEFQKRFEWWPTDAKPAPVEDKVKGGYWWWPTKPGTVGRVWGNRGYCYVRKMIFDYKAEELPAPKAQEPRPSLIIRKIIKNVKIYFDYDKADLRDDATPILNEAIRALKKNPEASILITGNCDIRGTEQYNDKLGRKRGDTVRQFMLDNGVVETRIKIISRGKLDAIAPLADLVGMQKDRNAQFMVAEVEEVMIPYPGQPAEPEAKPVEEGKYIVEKEEQIESKVQVSTKEYTTQKGDTLWDIAARELGSGHRWKTLYEFNKDRIKNPNKLRPGTKILIPVE